MKTTGAVEQKGFDAGKNERSKTANWHRRYSVVIHKADLHDTTIGYWATGLATFAYPTLEKICGDGGRRGAFVYEAYKYFGLRVEFGRSRSSSESGRHNNGNRQCLPPVHILR